MFDYDEESAHAVEVLDKYDFTTNLEKAKEQRMGCGDLIDYLGMESDEVSLALEDMTEDEVMIYLQTRYHIHFGEETSYYIY